MRPPYIDLSAMAIPPATFLLRENSLRLPFMDLRQVVHFSTCTTTLTPVVVSSLLLWHRRCGNEEVDFTPLELRLGGDDENSMNHPLAGGLSENMVWVGLENVAGGHQVAELLDVAVEVDDPDHIQGSAREDASQATSEAVSHSTSSVMAMACCIVRGCLNSGLGHGRGQLGWIQMRRSDDFATIY